MGMTVDSISKILQTRETKAAAPRIEQYLKRSIDDVC